MSKIKLLAVVFLFSIGFSALSQDSEYIYTEWLEGFYPTAHANVKELVQRVWGEDKSKVNSVVELHAAALSQLMDIRRSADTDEKIFSKALDMWSLSKEDERLSSWYEWPNTNWLKVLEEYNKQANPDSN